MSTVTGYALGYEDGRSATEISRSNREIVDRVFYGHRPVQVDQSYLDQIIHALADAQAASDHNFAAADAFELEAAKWKANAQAKEEQVAALKAELAERSPALDQAQRVLAQEQAAHQTTHDEKWGLNLFRLIATWLINAHIAGRNDRPAFAEMRDMAKDVTDAIERGEPFRGYQDEPEKKARLQALLEELLRP